MEISKKLGGKIEGEIKIDRIERRREKRHRRKKSRVKQSKVE